MLQVAKLIDQGRLQAPKVEAGEMLVLNDNGAAPNIANHEALPGAKLMEDPEASSSLSTATGAGFKSKGMMEVPVETLEGYKRAFKFKNADVSIPIRSTSLLADDNHDSLCSKKGCNLIHVPTGETIHVVRMHGVYFFRFKRCNSIIDPHGKKTPEFRTGMAI